MLEDGSDLAVFDMTPPIETCGGWCEGTGTLGDVVWVNSMERIADFFDSDNFDRFAWQTYWFDRRPCDRCKRRPHQRYAANAEQHRTDGVISGVLIQPPSL